MTLTEAIHNELDDIHVCLPGKIVAWDGKTATVKPSMPRALANGSELAAPQIVSVPVLFPTGLAPTDGWRYMPRRTRMKA